MAEIEWSVKELSAVSYEGSAC